MTFPDIQAPIGLHSAVDTIQRDMVLARVSPLSYLIDLDRGSGQTTLTRYLTELYAANGICSFSGPDRFLEYRLSGSLEQLKEIFRNIRDCAVYANHFRGVIAMDLTGLAYHPNELQSDLFMEEISVLSEYAALLFFVPTSMDHSADLLAQLIRRLRNTLGDRLRLLHADPYRVDELADLLKKFLSEAGVIAEDECLLTDAIRAEKVHTLPEVRSLSRTMILRADFSGSVPILHRDTILPIQDIPPCTPDCKGENLT